MSSVACLDDFHGFERRSSVPRGVTVVGSNRTTYESAIASPWQLDLAREANRLLALGHGWDSYGAEPIAESTILSTLNTLAEILTEETPAPRLVPGSAGTVQAEWCVDDLDVEIEFSGSPEIRVWYEDRSGAYETFVNEDVTPLLDVIQRLSIASRGRTRG